MLIDCVIVIGDEKYLNEILDKRSPPGELVGLLTDSLLAVRLLGFLGSALWRTYAHHSCFHFSEAFSRLCYFQHYVTTYNNTQSYIQP